MPLKSNLPRLKVYMRLANVAMAIMMVTSAVLSSMDDISSLVLGSYLTCFGCLLCCFETHLKQVGGGAGSGGRAGQGREAMALTYGPPRRFP